MVNVIDSTRLYENPDGYRELRMDNYYTSPELFVMLNTQFKFLACGTIQTNRKGWDQSTINLIKCESRGKSKYV